MSQYNCYLLSLNPDANIAEQWDFGFLKGILEDLNVKAYETEFLMKDKNAIVVIPARHHKGLEAQVNKELKKIENPILFCMGDEEADFAIEQIELPADRIYIQNPHMGKHDAYNKLGTGYPQHLPALLPKEAPIKPMNVFFAGQITHQRRRELNDVLLDYSRSDPNTRIIPTRGFTQGESKQDYATDMCKAKIAPCPSGAVIPDSFRLFEALECMTIPIADQKTPSGEVMQYWDWLFGQAAPFPKVVEWDRLFGLIPEILEDYPHNMHKITAWYIKYKRDFKLNLLEKLHV